MTRQYGDKVGFENKPIRTHKTDDWNGSRKKFDWPIRSIESKIESGLSVEFLPFHQFPI